MVRGGGSLDPTPEKLAFAEACRGSEREGANASEKMGRKRAASSAADLNIHPASTKSANRLGRCQFANLNFFGGGEAVTGTRLRPRDSSSSSRLGLKSRCVCLAQSASWERRGALVRRSADLTWSQDAPEPVLKRVCMHRLTPRTSRWL
jgi:hypothetical protein